MSQVLILLCGMPTGPNRATTWPLLLDLLYLISSFPSLQEVSQRFGRDLAALQAGQYDDWTRAYDGLAYIVLADQMSRHALKSGNEQVNLFRGRRLLSIAFMHGNSM